jgi:hypothetical protein
VPCKAVCASFWSSVRFDISKPEILHTPDISTRILSDFRSWNRVNDPLL